MAMRCHESERNRRRGEEDFRTKHKLAGMDVGYLTVEHFWKAYVFQGSD